MNKTMTGITAKLAQMNFFSVRCGSLASHPFFESKKEAFASFYSVGEALSNKISEKTTEENKSENTYIIACVQSIYKDKNVLIDIPDSIWIENPKIGKQKIKFINCTVNLDYKKFMESTIETAHRNVIIATHYAVDFYPDKHVTKFLKEELHSAIQKAEIEIAKSHFNENYELVGANWQSPNNFLSPDRQMDIELSSRDSIVLQWDTNILGERLEKIHKLEDELESLSKKEGELFIVDGHDVGDAVFNIFLIPNDTDKTKNFLLNLICQRNFPKGIRVGFSKNNDGHYTPLYPNNLSNFSLF